jgi:hypothetical protein
MFDNQRETVLIYFQFAFRIWEFGFWEVVIFCDKIQICPNQMLFNSLKISTKKLYHNGLMFTKQSYNFQSFVHLKMKIKSN